MATKVLNPRGWYRHYRDTEIAALKHLVDWLVRAGMTVTLSIDHVSYRATATGSGPRGHEIRIRASIKPYRDGSGLTVDADCRSLNERKMFDGQDYMFLHDDAEGMARLAAWFDENC